MESPAIRRRLKIALILVFFVMCVEVTGGIMAHSLALLSDAAHMLTDVFALSMSLMALTIAAQPSTRTKTFGYHRVEILAALANGILLLLMAIGQCGKNLHPVIPEGFGVGRRLSGDGECDQAQTESKGIRQHVGGVAQQGQAVSHDSTGDFHAEYKKHQYQCDFESSLDGR